MVGMSFNPPFYILLLLLAAIGFCFTAFLVIWDSSIQELVEEEVLGRVVSFQMFGGFLLLPFGYSIFGFLLDKVGTSLIMSIAGFSIILFASVSRTKKLEN